MNTCEYTAWVCKWGASANWWTPSPRCNIKALIVSCPPWSSHQRTVRPIHQTKNTGKLSEQLPGVYLIKSTICHIQYMFDQTKILILDQFQGHLTNSGTGTTEFIWHVFYERITGFGHPLNMPPHTHFLDQCLGVDLLIPYTLVGPGPGVDLLIPYTLGGPGPRGRPPHPLHTWWTRTPG